MGVNGEALQLHVVYKKLHFYYKPCENRISTSYLEVLFKALISPTGQYTVHNYIVNMCRCPLTHPIRLEL